MRLSSEKIRDLCRRKGIGLGELLQKAGVSRTAYYSLLRRDNLLPRSIRRIAEGLEIPPQKILIWEDRGLDLFRRLAAETDGILREHPDADRDNVRHALLLLRENPWNRLRRGLLRARTTSVHR